MVAGGLRAEEQDDLSRRLEKLRRNPVMRELLERGRKPELSDAQRAVLEKAVTAMSDADVFALLTGAGASTEGSVHRLRERVRILLNLDRPVTVPDSPRQGQIGLENAAEGEYLQGEDDSRGLLKLRGRIRLRLPGGVLTADSVIVDTKRREVYAQGNLEYRSRNGLVKAERFIYNQELGTGILYNASGYEKPIRFVGKNLIQTSPKQFALSHAWFTSCSAERPHYNFTARKVWIRDGRQITAVGVLYHIGGIPLLPLPFLYASDWGTGIVTQMGHGRVQGWFMQNTYQFSVPTAAASLWQPMYYRLTLDYYQKTGQAFGAELYKFSPFLNYIVQAGAAEYHRYEVIADFREKNAIRITNRVQRPDGTVGRDNYKWQKLFAIFNAKDADSATNKVRNVHLRYEGYTHQFYEFEFGGRYQPTSTIPALYESSEAGRGLIRPTTNWALNYNEQWDDLSLRVSAVRNRLWLDDPTPTEAHYVRANDVVPSVDIEKRFFVARLPVQQAPLYWRHRLHTDIKNEYSAGKAFRSLNNNLYQTDFATYLSFYPYITFRPLVGYGAQKTIPQNATADADVEREARRSSYQSVFTEDELTIGPDLLHVRTVYRRKDSFKEEEADASILSQKDRDDIRRDHMDTNQKVNESEVGIESVPVHNLTLGVSSIYDHRTYREDVGYRERWFYPIFRVDYLVDFLNFGRLDRENLLSSRRLHFLQMRLTDDLLYDSLRQEYHSNLAGINFQAGGFELPLLKRLRYVEMGFYWYHVYENQALDHMRFSLKTDVQLTRTLFFEMELESRAVDPERYVTDSVDQNGNRDHVNVRDDVANGTGLNGARKRQETVFNIGYFECALVIDLHEWEMRLGYSIEQRSILAGVGSLEIVNFYDNKVFFSMTLLRFDVGSTRDRPSRFLLNRRRVHPGDVGRTGIGATRN